jgi:CRISPR-associated endonuclease/helicase Cas3
MFAASVNEKDGPSSHDLLWGKWGNAGEHRYPLLAHLLDSAAAMEAVFDLWVPAHLAERLQELVGGEDLRQVLVSVAALHDLGKASPYFQGQLLSPRSDQFAGHVQSLKDAGFEIPETHAQGEERRLLARHEIASSSLLAGGLELPKNAGIALVVNGHHGRWSIPGEEEAYNHPSVCRFYNDLATAGQWAAAITHMRAVLASTAGASGDMALGDVSAVPLLTPLVCLADWLASDEHLLRGASSHLHLLDAEPHRFYEHRRDVFTKAVPDLLGVPTKPEASFSELFGFEPSRPVQQAMVRPARRGLTVAMVPMGEGKTEAALGQWLLSAGDREGLYFALPTMATADAMFDRVRDLFAKADEHVIGAISHGRSILNSFYADPAAGRRVVSGSGLVPGDWFSGRHRTLLAPVAVGTVDQLLAGALRHRYGFMRLLAASGKTIVLDEVHSYDPYMAELLCRLLVWLGHTRTNVILLSATLPKRRLQKFLDAYAKGWGSPLEPLGDVPYPAVISYSAGGVEIQDLSNASSGRECSVSLEYHLNSDVVAAAAELVAQAREQHPEAKIGVIVNTVGTAQHLSTELEQYQPLLLHSRLPARERAERAAAAIARFGKNSTPGPDLMIATQVVEQSIDVDFDILISALCPAPSLLQRMGRVWRHDRGAQRPRPGGLPGPVCHVVAPAPLPQKAFAFLPYSGAEIHATWDRALLGGNRSLVAIPRDVQAMVNAADVSFEDLQDERQALVERHLVAAAGMQTAASEVVVPTPAQITADHFKLELMTRGDLGAEERSTRWSQLPTAVLLPCSAENPAAWNGPLPATPTRAEVLELLAHTIPVSGRLASLLQAKTASEGTVRTGLWDHRLLADLVVVDLDENPWLCLDSFLGLYEQRSET